MIIALRTDANTLRLYVRWAASGTSGSNSERGREREGEGERLSPGAQCVAEATIRLTD